MKQILTLKKFQSTGKFLLFKKRQRGRAGQERKKKGQPINIYQRKGLVRGRTRK